MSGRQRVDRRLCELLDLRMAAIGPAISPDFSCPIRWVELKYIVVMLAASKGKFGGNRKVLLGKRLGTGNSSCSVNNQAVTLWLIPPFPVLAKELSHGDLRHRRYS